MHTDLMTGNRQLRVLVVDDHRDSADSLACVLHNIGHIVRTAYNAASALLAFDDISPELIFQDLLLPGKNGGVEIAREIRRRRSSDNAVLIAMTGAHDLATLRASERGLFDHLILKPVGLEQLNEILGKACARADAHARDRIRLQSSPYVR